MRRSGFDVGHAMAQRLGRVALAGAALLAACDAVPADVPQIPRIGPAHEAGGAAALAVRGPIQLALDDVSFRTSLGHQVSIERIEVMGEAGRISRDRVELDLVRIVGLDVVTPADTIVTGFDAFIEVPGPRLIVRTLRVEDARFAAEAHPGQAPGPWLWRMPRLDLVATDVRLGGDELERLTLERLRAIGELRGEPFAVTSAQARVTRGAGVLRYDAAVALPASRLAAAGSLRRTGRFVIDATADTLAFEDVHAFVDRLPTAGGAEFRIGAAGAGDAVRLDIARLVADWPDAAFEADGTIDTGDSGGVSDLRVRIARYDAAPQQDLAGTAFDVAGRWSGVVVASGAFRDGVRIEADLTREPDSIGVQNATAAGTLRRTDGLIDVALDVDARLATPDTGAWIADDGGVGGARPEADVAGRASASGSVSIATNDSVGAGVRGSGRTAAEGGGAGVRGSGRTAAEAGGSAGRADDPGDTRIVDVDARVTGTVALDDEGPLDLLVQVDTVPLALAPLPASIDSVRGLATATVRIEGTREAPRWAARLNLEDGALFVRPAALPVTSIAAAARIESDTLWVDSLDARAAGGWIRAAGSVALDDARTLAFTVTADSLRVEPVGGTRADSAGIAELRGGITADVRVTGTMDAPRLAGSVRVRDGGLVVERTNTRVDSLDAVLRLDGERAVIDTLRARVGGGLALASGVFDWSGDAPALRVALGLDSARVIDMDSARVTASARITAAGRLDRPTVDGTVILLEGRVHEDAFARDPPLDLEQPEYTELAARAPWLEDSRLRRAWAARDTTTDAPPFDGELRIEIRRGMRIVDEDSELGGTGVIRIRAGSSRLAFDGVYRVDSGEYAQYGEVLNVVGGAITFNGGGFAPSITIRSEHHIDQPLGIGYDNALHPLDDVPRIESFAIGTIGAASEEARRLSLLPETKDELGARLLYGIEPPVVTGLDAAPFFLPDDGTSLVGSRARTQSVTLLYGYAGNELYDFIPPLRAGLRSGAVTVGSRFPGRIVVAPVLTAYTRVGPVRAQITQPVGAGSHPGVMLRLGIGRGAEIWFFDEPRFTAAPPAGLGWPGFLLRRRTGFGLRWDAER